MNFSKLFENGNETTHMLFWLKKNNTSDCSTSIPRSSFRLVSNDRNALFHFIHLMCTGAYFTKVLLVQTASITS